MTAFEDVLLWADSRPQWQQKVLARLAGGDVLDESDHEEIAKSLFASSEDSPGGSWIADLLPVTDTAGQRVWLRSVSNLVGVNRLAADQELTFSPDGLTVVFGNNGSGKSGYARVIRSMVRTRHQADILPDVFDDVPTPQQGSVTFTVGEVERVATIGSPKDPDLSRVAFYDEHCGDTYLNAETEISYRPSAIQLLDDLATVCAGVRQVIDRWRQEARQPGPLPQVDSLGPSGRFLQDLVATTADEEIQAATACPANIDQLLEDQVRVVAGLRTADPARDKRRHADVATALDTIVDNLVELDTSLGTEAQRRLDELTQAATRAREAAAAASRASFADEPLAEVGSGAWQSLWRAAEEYSKSAYPDHSFPHTGDEAVCVLCQQRLTDSATERLTRFRDFVTDTTVRQAQVADSELATFRRQLQDIEIIPHPVLAALAVVKQDTDAFTESLEGLWQALRDRRDAMLAGGQSLPPAGKEMIHGLRRSAQEHREQGNRLEVHEHAQQLQQAEDKERRLREQRAMRDGRELIECERARLKRVANLDAKFSETNTRSITDKVGELTREYVTEEAQHRFIGETVRLGLERVTFRATKARRGALLHKADFLNARRGVQLAEVLSEGEQTALGFAGFLTEAHFETSRSALVLDDPVSSLDHMKRAAVANRIADLAEERQVVVFTHDIAFTMLLRKAAGEHGVQFATRGVEHRRKVGPGFTTLEHPWTAQDASQRIETLRQQVARLRRNEDGMTEADYQRETEDIAGHMSQTWERIISQVLAEPLVDYKSLEVRVSKLRVIGRVSPDDVKAYDDSYSRISGWASRHDQHPELNYTPPTVPQLQDEIEVLATWLKTVKKYQSS